MTSVAGAIALDVEYCSVYIGADKVFTVTNTRLIPALERAEQISDRLQQIVTDPSIDPADFQVRTGLDGVPVIYIGNTILCGVTTQDAANVGRSELETAKHWILQIQRSIKEARKTQSHSDTPKNQQGERKKPVSTSLSEHAVLLLFIELSILLLASLVCGELMVKLGQPAIIGQILAGLLLGQTFFGLLFPDLSTQLFPRDGSQSKLIEAISWIGVSFLLLLTGMETDTSMLNRQGKTALYLAVIGVVIPLTIGAFSSFLLPDQLFADPSHKVAFAVFLGTVFAASSVPVVAKILMDMKMLKMDIGQLIMATSLSHDLLCCLLLAVIVVLSGSGSAGGGAILTAILGTAGFTLVLYFGRPVFFAMLRWVNDHVSSSDGLITSMILLLLVSAATTQALGIHIVLGAFAAGFILSQSPVVNHKVVRPIEIITMGFFAPIFFASSGLNVNLSSLLDPKLLAITLALSIAALVSKLISCLIVGKITGLGRWEALSIGVGANAKGSLGLILAMLGYSLNIISLDMLGIVIFIALFSTAITAPLMKFTMQRVEITAEEKDRIKREERQARTILSGIRRVLWPTTGKGRNKFIAKLLNSIGQRQVIETTALWVTKEDSNSKEPFDSIREVIDKKHVGLLERTVKSDKTIEAIAEEANRGYDLVLMASDEPAADSNYVFAPLVDGVILETSARVLVVYDPNPSEDREIKKVLVPVSGTELSVSAGEFGISLAKSLNAKVICLSISEAEAKELYGEQTASGQKIEKIISDEISETLAELSAALDVDFESLLIQTSSHPAQATILTAEQHDIDLIVLGAEPKLGTNLFFGHTINFILRNAPCAIAVLKLRG